MSTRKYTYFVPILQNKKVLSHPRPDCINNDALAIEIASMKYYITYCHRDKINDIDPRWGTPLII